MSLLSICAEAIESLGPFNVPTTIIGNNDPDALILKWAATQTGRELVRVTSWQALLTPTTFVTAPTVSQYSLPADFRRFSGMTFYNVSQYRELIGPYSPASWAALTRGTTISTFLYSFRVAGNFIELTPAPSAIETVGYDYYSKYYSTTNLGVAQAEWTSDTDLPRLDSDLFTLGIRYRFLQRKELPFAEDKADYLDALRQLIYDDTPKGIIDLSGVPRMTPSNIPDGSWG